jgi:hypothetical protein
MADDQRDVNEKPNDTIFDRLVPGRECGECVACCKILEIEKPELQKPADVLCKHCVGAGCGIYETRPTVCRTWFCLWRRIDQLPDYLRPDRCGVVFSLDQHDPPRIMFERLYIVARAIDRAEAFDAGPVRATLDMFAEEGSLPVWVSFKGAKRMVYPGPEFADAILRPDQTPRKDLVAKALSWRKGYGLD